MQLPQEIKFIITAVEECGYQAFVVGGAVRDSVLGCTPKDYDIATNATCEQVQNIFSHFKNVNVINTGVKYGTVTIVVNHNPVEVTTFRSEEGYSDARRPEKVSFVFNIKDDLARRDFTVNAIAYNKKCGFVDLYFGISDIKKRILRTVGNPNKRFSEDALRILRLFRFASTLGFKIEEETLNAAIENADRLKKISVERIFIELDKLLCGENPSSIIPLIKSGGLEFLGLHYTEELSRLNNILATKNQAVKWINFIKYCECEVDIILNNLKMSKSLKRDLKLLEKISFGNVINELEVRLIIAECGINLFEEYIKVNQNKNVKNLFNIIQSSDIILNIMQLNISGNDYKHLLKNERDIGAVKQQLFLEVITQKLDNNHKDLLRRAINLSALANEL